MVAVPRKLFLALAIAVGGFAAQAFLPGMASADGGDGLPGQPALGDVTGGVSETPGQTFEAVTDAQDEQTNETISEPAKSVMPAVNQRAGRDTEPVTETGSRTAGPVTEPAGETLEPITESTGETVAPVTETPGQTPALAAETVADAAGPIAKAAPPVLEPVAGATKPAAGSVADAVEPAVAPIVEAVEPVVAPVVHAAQPVVEQVIEITEPVVEPIGEVTEAVLAPIEDILPLAGVPVMDASQPLETQTSALMTGSAVTSGPATLSATLPNIGPAGTVAAEAAMPAPADGVLAPETSLTPRAQSTAEVEPPPRMPALNVTSHDALRLPAEPGAETEIFIAPGSAQAVFGAPQAPRSQAGAQPGSGLAQALVGATGGSGNGPRVDWPPASLPASLLGLFAGGALILLAVTEASPRTWQFRPYTPPA